VNHGSVYCKSNLPTPLRPNAVHANLILQLEGVYIVHVYYYYYFTGSGYTYACTPMCMHMVLARPQRHDSPRWQLSC
jgi:hypothetical protein